MTASTYSPNGAGHRILARLEQGPAFVEAFHDFGRSRRDIYFTIGALARDSLILCTKAGYEITTAGTAKLDELDRAAGKPRAQVFGAMAG